MNRLQTNSHVRKLSLLLLVFVLALLPRVTHLQTFLTADEDDQFQFAASFLQAVQRQDWGGALVLGYPGVPTMSLGATGLWTAYQSYLHEWSLPQTLWPAGPTALAEAPPTAHQLYLPFISENESPKASLGTFLGNLQSDPLTYILPLRLPMALTASLSILLIFVLLRQLLPGGVAFFSTLLIAFDPLFLANSRVIHVDAPLTYFMFTSFLAFVVYIQRGNWGWLIASGVLGGLGMLSKTPGVLLGPILVAAGASYLIFVHGEPNRRERFKRFGLALGGWGLLAAVAFFALWPSMWSRPLFALELITRNIMGAFDTVHPSSGQFWGPVTDHSPWYYLVAWPFHLTPLTSLGLLLGLGLLGSGILAYWRKQDSPIHPYLPLLLALLAYLVLFMGPVSLVSRRGVRYLLPIFPAAALLAGMSLWLLSRQIQHRWSQIGFGLLVSLQVLQVAFFHPYYFSYVNPLLGGAQTAERFVTIGWGEGLNEAASYLNAKPNAAAQTVAAWYSGQFAPYFRGQTIDLASNEPAYRADYTIFYLNQIQRRLPSVDLVEYFEDREPEAVVSIHGLDYAWIYPGPIIGGNVPPLRYPLNVTFNNTLHLTGLDLPVKTLAADSQTLPVTLYWRPLEQIPGDFNVAIRIVDELGVVWGSVDRLPLGGLLRTNAWPAGEAVRDEYRLNLNPATPPGTYTFDILIYNFRNGEVFGQVRRVGAVNITPAGGPIQADQLDAVIPNKLSVSLADNLQLIGHDFEATSLTPGRRHLLQLYWFTGASPRQDHELILNARHENGQAFELLRQPIGPDTLPTSQWRAGQVLGSSLEFAMPIDAPPGRYDLQVQVVEGGPEARLGQLQLEELLRLRDIPNTNAVTPLAAYFGEEIALAGYEFIRRDTQLELSLYWQAAQQPNKDYKVFIHLSTADEAIIDQRDQVPDNGGRPTSGWAPGEFIIDRYTLPMPNVEDAVIWVGLYDPLTLERLPVSGPVETSANRLKLLTLESPTP